MNGGVLPPQARDLYLDMREKFIDQSVKYFDENAILLSDA
jgi:hypothetical protein